jgi:uncharacterized protein YciI
MTKENTMLYLILLRYRASLDDVDRHVDAHRRFLHEQYAAGRFLLSGAQEPRVGGAILARGGSRDELAQLLEQDPFKQAGIADYEIIAWAPTLRHADVPAGLAPDAVIGGVRQ